MRGLKGGGGRGHTKLRLAVLNSDRMFKEALGPNCCPAHLLSGTAIIEKVTESKTCEHPHVLWFSI